MKRASDTVLDALTNSPASTATPSVANEMASDAVLNAQINLPTDINLTHLCFTSTTIITIITIITVPRK